MTGDADSIRDWIWPGHGPIPGNDLLAWQDLARFSMILLRASADSIHFTSESPGKPPVLPVRRKARAFSCASLVLSLACRRSTTCPTPILAIERGLLPAILDEETLEEITTLESEEGCFATEKGRVRHQYLRALYLKAGSL